MEIPVFISLLQKSVAVTNIVVFANTVHFVYKKNPIGMQV